MIQTVRFSGPSSDVPRSRWIAVAALCVATVLLVPLERFVSGGAFLLVAAVAAFRDPSAGARRRLGVLIGTIVVLAAAPIHTDLSNRHFLTLGSAFFLVILGPALILGRTDPGVIRYRFWPRRFRWLDIFYVAISIPLSWGAFELYFRVFNPEVPGHWPLPPGALEDNMEHVWRLFVGINCVGIWDELFFVNTVFAILRSILPMRWANLSQAVIYTSILNDMAFTGIGPILIYIFALTQGSMFEESENLLYVLVVHLIVDAFLVAGILQFAYGQSPIPF